MTPENLLIYLEQRDIRLWCYEGKLRCDAPKGILTAEIRQQITEHKADLLRLLAKHPPAPSANPQPLSSIARTDELPLSFSQQRIWALSRVDPESNVTGNLPFGFRISGALNVAALAQSINHLIQRHAVLRTGCQTVQARPVQATLPVSYVPLPMHDLRYLLSNEKTAAIRQFAQQATATPFNLAEPPLLHACLLHTDEAEYLWFLTTHVYVFDGWSTAILLQEIATLYADCCANRAPTLPPLPVQYGDFAHWHRQWFSANLLAEQKAYWQKTLAGALLVTGLPTDRPRTPQSIQHIDRVAFTLPDFLANQARALAQHARVTLFITLLAAFQTLLQRYTQQANVTIGTIVSNRKVAESEGLIGSFANNLLLRADFAAGLTFQELLVQVRQQTQAAFAHQDLPLETLLGELDDGLNRSPLFRVMFLFYQHQSLAAQRLDLAGVEVEHFAVEKAVSKYELNLIMTDVSSVLSGVFEYSTDRFDALTIQRLAENFLLILKTVTADPTRPLIELPCFMADRLRPPGMASDFADGARPESAGVNALASTVVHSATVATLTQIWQKFFGVNPIGLHDNFVELGGHSLLAAGILAAIEAQFGIEMPIKRLFEFPTIAEFAHQIHPIATTAPP